MLSGLKFGVVLLTLGGFACGEAGSPVDYLTENGRKSMEDDIRLTVYHECGGDGELRCQQFAPSILRGIAPTIPLRVTECRETGRYPRRVRDCAFVLGEESGLATPCRMTFREAPGIHSLYWATGRQVPPKPPGASARPSVATIPEARSSLDCSGPLLALTRALEGVDPARAAPANPLADLTTLITADDYPIPGLTNRPEGIVTMSLRVGSNGRIERCAITRSSGAEALDKKACQMFRMRARFSPARSAEGRAITAEISHSHEWKAPR